MPPLHVNEKVSTVWKQDLEPSIQKFTWEVAQDVLAEEVERGFPTDPVVITDGRYRADPRQVKPFGKIEFVARAQLAEIIAWIYGQLVERSPVLRTQPYIYVESHVIMVNGQAITGARGQAIEKLEALQRLKPTDRVQIVNTVPYARKIESATASKKTGRQKRKSISTQRGSRGGVYRPVASAAKQRYGRVAFIDFKYVKLDLGVKVWGQQGGKFERRKGKGQHRFAAGQAGGTNRRRVQRDQVYPAIQISQGAAVRY